jgi:hypothetical protein
MPVEITELDEMQKEYKAAVEKWVAAIREEEELASTEHSVADIDRWEAAEDNQQELGKAVHDAKCRYEDALREKFFNF